LSQILFNDANVHEPATIQMTHAHAIFIKEEKEKKNPFEKKEKKLCESRAKV
jgi:hypothetical protein